MRPHKLLNLLRANARRGEFRAEAETNTLWLYDVIVSSEADAEWFGGVPAETFAKQLASMSGPVSLRINSPGGDVFAGVAMAQAIRNYPGQVTAYVDGLAASAASVVAVGADRVVMGDGSMLMIHKAWTLALGNADDFIEVAALLEKIDGQLAATYAKKAGRPAAEFAELMAAETWLTAEEAIELGLADEQAERPEKVQASAAKWDLSAFEKAPKIDAETEVTVTEDDTGVTVTITVEDAEEEAAEPAEAEPTAENEIEQRVRALRARLLLKAA